MRNFKLFTLIALVALVFTSCSRVAPNYQGVMMENYGQNGKSDFKLVKGKVWTLAPGTELFQVPLFDQRGRFIEQIQLKASNNTEFKAAPKYSYRVIEDRAIDVAFAGSRLDGDGEAMLDAIEDDILEPRIDDLIKEFSRSYHTDSLMATGGQLLFEKDLEKAVAVKFEEVGFELITFQSQLQFTSKVTNVIDERNETDTKLSLLDSQIEEQRKINELAELRTQEALIKTRGLTPEILQWEFIQKWDGKTPIYGAAPFFIKPLPQQ
jgi:hypothetical protein